MAIGQGESREDTFLSCVGISSGKYDGGHLWRPKGCKVGRENQEQPRKAWGGLPAASPGTRTSHSSLNLGAAGPAVYRGAPRLIFLRALGTEHTSRKRQSQALDLGQPVSPAPPLPLGGPTQPGFLPPCVLGGGRKGLGGLFFPFPERGADFMSPRLVGEEAGVIRGET